MLRPMNDETMKVTQDSYEAPAIASLGSFVDLTQAKGNAGPDAVTHS